MNLLWLLAVTAVMPTATDQRINLADFGRVVKFVNDTPAGLEVEDLESGPDGWPVWIGEDGQSMIGLEWDEARDVAEVEIEFRHAIADRDQIRVQYFLGGPPTTQPGEAAHTPDTFHGRWVTAKTDWWAGDRFVGFAFAPMNEELPEAGMPAYTYRRTCRLRFVLGKRKVELPAVRYLRAYAPAEPMEANLEVRLDRLSPLRVPLQARVVNGLFIEESGETLQSLTVESVSSRMRIRFGGKDIASASRSIVTLADGKNGSNGLSFLPAEVVERGIVGVPSLGVSIVHVGSGKDFSKESKPGESMFDRLKAGAEPTLEGVWRDMVGSQDLPGSPLTEEDRKLASGRYQKILDAAMSVVLPEPVLNDFYQAQVVRLLMSADGGREGESISPEAFTESARPVQSCPQVRALDVVGVSGAAEVFLNACLRLVPEAKPAGRFGSKVEGFLTVPKTGSERSDCSTLEHGVLLCLIGQHYRYNYDRRWLTKNASRLKEACRFVIRQSEADKEINTLGRDDVFWGEGLLPPGPVAGTTAWAWWLTADAYAARGMRLIVEGLAEVNEPGADRLAKEATAFDDHVARSCREAMLNCPVARLADGQYVPMQPIRSRFRGREPNPSLEAAHGAIHLIDCGMYTPGSMEAEWILRGAEDNVLPGAGMGKAALGIDSKARTRFLKYCSESAAGPPPLTTVYLQRGQYRHALRAFYGMLATELIPKPSVSGSSGSDDPNVVGASLLVWLREMLIHERGRELDLLAGVPTSWLTKGRSISVKRAPTWFGPMDLSVESASDANRITIRWAGLTRQGPEGIRLWVRAPQNLLTVTCNGQLVAKFDPASGLIQLPGDLDQAELVVTY